MTISTPVSPSAIMGDAKPLGRDAASASHEFQETLAAASAGVPADTGRKRKPARGADRSIALLHAGAALIWLPQAGLLAFSVGMIADGASMRAILPAALTVLFLGVLRAWLEKVASRLSFRAARRELSRQRAEALEAMAQVSPLDASRTASGEAASVIAESAEALVPYLSRYLPARMKATVVPLVFFVAILPFSWIAALVLLLAMPTIPLFMALIGWQAKAASEKQLAETGNMNAFLLDRLRGLQTIRALGAVDLTARRLRDDAENLKKRTMAVLRIAFLSSAVLELFAALGVAMTAVYVGFHLLGFLEFGAWGQRLTLSEGLFILLLAPAFFEPMRELSGVWHDRAAGEAAMDALRQLKGDAVVIVGSGTDVPSRSVPSGFMLEIDGLSFAYPDASQVIRSFSLSVREGETIALLGPSGCGKSTLLSLIAGFAAADAGSIKIGGVALDAETASTLRSTIGWISQKPFFLAGSLKANVRFGRSDIGQSEVEGALFETGLADLADARQHCSVGDGGYGISGGEAVRLAIARAVANPATKVLLADEPTAHLDRRTAESITENLLRLAKGRTVIVATHDPVLAARMDRVVDLAAITQGEKP
ncbi:thiol reductant ABC exporter subunit CydD [Agrobacterium tumefaciens]|uniref:thiol reductant ABC exporter subunit CydD n=1 Tax=Agrobacterium tumefaciens TaxID=358 RepID=UPI00287E49C0|nr:thiol reductant ABC exporter subunit CydD [Agrobacterium tumefaciens]MDS7595104.1 thiol reductant ABC exporter subunit CydD [Agrobacterium tumefaciens]